MTWLLIAYCAFFVAITAYWLHDEWQETKRLGPIVLELFLDVCLILAALGFWLASARGKLGGAALPLFAIGSASVLTACVRELPGVFKDSDLTRAGQWATASGATVLIFAFYGPLLYWGFSYSVLGEYVST